MKGIYMSTHDAGKLSSNPAERRTLTRDPKSPSGPIVESGKEKNGLRVTTAGSSHCTTNIDGKWYVCDTRGEKLLDQEFASESDATAEAERNNDLPEDKKTA